jgi:hypothetical protein
MVLEEAEAAARSLKRRRVDCNTLPLSTKNQIQNNSRICNCRLLLLSRASLSSSPTTPETMSTDEQISTATASAYTNAIANHRASIAEVAVALDPAVCEASGKALKGRVVVVTGELPQSHLHDLELMATRDRRWKWVWTRIRDQGSRVWGQGRPLRRERPFHRRYRHCHPSFRGVSLSLPRAQRTGIGN